MVFEIPILWRAGALAESWIVPEDEADWPTVLTA